MAPEILDRVCENIRPSKRGDVTVRDDTAEIKTVGKGEQDSLTLSGADLDEGKKRVVRSCRNIVSDAYLNVEREKI